MGYPSSPLVGGRSSYKGRYGQKAKTLRPPSPGDPFRPMGSKRGLSRAMTRVNPTARAAIQRAMDRKPQRGRRSY